MRRDGSECPWPHEVPTSEWSRELDEVIGEFRPHITRVARWLAGEDEALERELDQEGCLLLWELGVAEIRAREAKHVCASLVLRMRSERRRLRREVAP